MVPPARLPDLGAGRLTVHDEAARCCGGDPRYVFERMPAADVAEGVAASFDRAGMFLCLARPGLWPAINEVLVGWARVMEFRALSHRQSDRHPRHQNQRKRKCFRLCRWQEDQGKASVT